MVCVLSLRSLLLTFFNFDAEIVSAFMAANRTGDRPIILNKYAEGTVVKHHPLW